LNDWLELSYDWIYNCPQRSGTYVLLLALPFSQTDTSQDNLKS